MKTFVLNNNQSFLYDPIIHVLYLRLMCEYFLLKIAKFIYVTSNKKESDMTKNLYVLVLLKLAKSTY